MWNGYNCMAIWAFFGIPFFGIGMKTDLFLSCGHCWVFWPLPIQGTIGFSSWRGLASWVANGSLLLILPSSHGGDKAERKAQVLMSPLMRALIVRAPYFWPHYLPKTLLIPSYHLLMPSFWSILEFQHMNLGAQTLNSWYINNLSSYLKREKLASGIKKNKDESEKSKKWKTK